jgi:GH24 family phage-related lysozyme (muramidase)
MILDARLQTDIMHAEGCPVDHVSGLPVAYKDDRGFWTGGYGHLLDQTIDWTGYTWSWDQVKSWLSTDIQKKAAQAVQLSEWPALDTSCRQNAVIECLFNLGATRWTSPPPHGFPATRRSIAAKDWKGAHDNLLHSPLWIAEVGLARVERLANYLLTGAYP